MPELYSSSLADPFSIACGTHEYTGHNLTGHDYLGHNYISHNCVGHNYIGHNCVGHNYTGHNCVGSADPWHAPSTYAAVLAGLWPMYCWHIKLRPI